MTFAPKLILLGWYVNEVGGGSCMYGGEELCTQKFGGES
jgi:hypothetical protein